MMDTLYLIFKYIYFSFGFLFWNMYIGAGSFSGYLYWLAFFLLYRLFQIKKDKSIYLKILYFIFLIFCLLLFCLFVYNVIMYPQIGQLAQALSVVLAYLSALGLSRIMRM